VIAFSQRELKALEASLAGTLSGRSNKLNWGGLDQINLLEKLRAFIAEGETNADPNQPESEPERRCSASL
jgi:hypothetical protein